MKKRIKKLLVGVCISAFAMMFVYVPEAGKVQASTENQSRAEMRKDDIRYRLRKSHLKERKIPLSDGFL